LKPEAIVVHIIVGSLTSADNSFRNPRHGCSAHYGVGRRGEVHQYVAEEDTAYHAGTVVEPRWRLIRSGQNPNLYTVGVEHEGMPDDDWPDAQYGASADLIAEIAHRWRIPIDADHVIPHRDIRASKTCPGTVDLARLVGAAQGSLRRFTHVSPGAQRLRVRVPLNVRSGAPSTDAPIARTVRPPLELSAIEAVRGESIRGNATWYRVGEDAWIWSGGVEPIER
jgi:hypothetical protein